MSENNKKNDFEETRIFYAIKDEKTETPPSQKRGHFHTFKRVMAIIVMIGLTIGLILSVFGIAITYRMILDAPKLQMDDFISNESTKIYDAQGELVTEIGSYLRENITYNKLTESIVDAFLSIEDSRYFEHNGFDVPRFTKAIIENIKSRSFGQGGSTFTMQLIKNTYFQIDDGDNSKLASKSIDRKVQEIYLALNLDKQLDKKTIFQLYINKLNFGGNVRGVQKASQYYFGKEANSLNVSEAALLAGIINRPNAYNPYRYLDYATYRRNRVLEMMFYHGYLKQEEAELAQAIPVENLLVGENFIQTGEDNAYQSYIDVVINEAQQLTGKDPYVNGMQIYTSMERESQETIDGIQNGSIDIPWPDDLLQVAMITVNNKTGEIVGIGGGRNYNGARLLNRATSQFKQPGSSVKPILSYALAFEYLGYSDKMVLTDKPITYPLENRVLKNFDGEYRGDIQIDQAVAQSLNIPAILTLEDVVNEIGTDKVVEYLNAIGFTKVTKDNFHLSFAIGGTWFETTVFELAGAQAALMNLGVYNKPHTIRKIVFQDGETVYPNEQNRRVLSSGSAYLVDELLQYTVEGPYFNYLQILKRNYPVYGKTGTTDWGSDGVPYGIPKGIAKDKIMLSSTSLYTNAIWLGYDKAIKGEQTYFTPAKSRLNIPGRISKILLDTNEKLSSSLPTAIEKPSDVKEITYVYGSWPYAKFEDWMDLNLKVTANISQTGEKELVNIQDTAQTMKFNGVSALINTDGSLTVTWSIGSGGCMGNIKDISLHDAYNDIPAYGNCLFDYSWVLGSTGTYGANIFVNDQFVTQIQSNSNYYNDWPADLNGTVKVCGWYNNGTEISETDCSIAVYSAS